MNTTSDLTAPRVSSGPVAGLTLAALLAALGTSVANVALPTLAEEFGIASGRAQWVVLAYLLAMTVTAVQVGRLGDRFGRQRILLIGLLLFLAATLACALAPSFTFLVTARAVQGIGAAVLVALPLAIARDLFPSERLGSVMGVLGTAAAVGTALGPAAGGLLLSAFGWPAMFLAVLPLGVLALVLLIGGLSVLVDGSPGSRRKPWARGGTVALMRTLPFSAALVMNLLVATVMTVSGKNTASRRSTKQLKPYTYPEPTISKSASTPGSILDQRGHREVQHGRSFSTECCREQDPVAGK